MDLAGLAIRHFNRERALGMADTAHGVVQLRGHDVPRFFIRLEAKKSKSKQFFFCKKNFRSWGFRRFNPARSGAKVFWLLFSKK
jgi:hypothetical protein